MFIFYFFVFQKYMYFVFINAIDNSKKIIMDGEKNCTIVMRQLSGYTTKRIGSCFFILLQRTISLKLLRFPIDLLTYFNYNYFSPLLLKGLPLTFVLSIRNTIFVLFTDRTPSPVHLPTRDDV